MYNSTPGGTRELHSLPKKKINFTLILFSFEFYRISTYFNFPKKYIFIFDNDKIDWPVL